MSDWFGEAYNPKLAKYRRVLVISGPSGSAKTATLRMLAQEQEVDVLEFNNGSNLAYAGGDYGSPLLW